MKPVSSKKLLLMNTGLLLGVAALFFRVYLPVVEEIGLQNQQLKQYEQQLRTLKASVLPVASQEKQQVQALPESELEHLSEELEALAQKHHLTLIQVEPIKNQAEKLSKYKLTLTPYTLGFAGKEPQAFAEMLAELKSRFPELSVEQFEYSKEVATVEARLLTSSKSVRLFAP